MGEAECLNGERRLSIGKNGGKFNGKGSILEKHNGERLSGEKQSGERLIGVRFNG